MINAGTVGAYLELDISHFKHNLETAGKMLEQFRTQKESVFNDNGSPGTALFDALTAPITAAGKAAAAFAGIFGREMGTVREDARVTGAVIGGIGDNFNNISGSAEKAGSGILSALGKIPDNARRVIQSSCQGMKTELAGAAPALSAAAKNDGNSIVSAFDKTVGSGKLLAVGKNAVLNLSKGMHNQKPAATSTITGIMQGMLSAAGKVKFNGIGSSVVAGIAKGMNSGKSGLFATAASIASGIAARIKSVLKISSPSKVTQEIGLFTARGLALGLNQEEHALFEAGQTAADSIRYGMTDRITGTNDAIAAYMAEMTSSRSAARFDPQGDRRADSTLAGIAASSAISLETAEVLGNITSQSMHYTSVDSMNYGSRLDRLDKILDAVERLADAQTTMEIDGRPFGRLVREYV